MSKDPDTPATEDFSRELRLELLATFHRQFAENQREKEQSFLRFAAFVGATAAAYGYVYQRSPVDLSLLSLTALAASGLMLFGSCVIVTIAYNWRRDQLVNANIRRMAGVIGTKNIFPNTYDPAATLTEKNLLTWIPNMLAVFWLLIVTMQVLILLSYVNRLGIKPAMSTSVDLTTTFTFWISIVCITASIATAAHFKRKLHKFIRVAGPETGTGVGNDSKLV